MAARPTWKGYLKISLVNIPVKVFPATDAAATLSFNQLHAACQSRIQQKRWCPQCQKEVPNTDIVKGYEYSKGQFVLFTEEELEGLEQEVTKTIEIEEFLPVEKVDPVYLDRTYYLAPDKGGARSYQLLAKALAFRDVITSLTMLESSTFRASTVTCPASIALNSKMSSIWLCILTAFFRIIFRKRCAFSGSSTAPDSKVSIKARIAVRGVRNS